MRTLTSSAFRFPFNTAITSVLVQLMMLKRNVLQRSGVVVLFLYASVRSG